jgi:hypothetical protein
MGLFVAGSSRSHQSAAWAGVGRASELLVRGDSSQDLFLGRGERTVASRCWSQRTSGEVRGG